MIPELIEALAARITNSNLVERSLGLISINTVNGNKEPVAWQEQEPQHINLDDYQSLTFFLLNGPVAQTQQDNDVSCGVLITKKVPIRLVYFASFNAAGTCMFIDERALQNLVSTLVFQDDKALRNSFSLSSINVSATAQELRRDAVWQQVFGNTNSLLKENQQLLSADFDLMFEGNPACWVDTTCTTTDICITVNGGDCLTAHNAGPLVSHAHRIH